MADPDKIRALLSMKGDEPERPVRIPQPTAPEVGYAGPNPDGSRKRCGNCYKFIATGACVEVMGRIEPGMVCNFHLFGRPQDTPPLRAPTPKSSAVDAGLISSPLGEGTSCNICRFYTPDSQQRDIGLCAAVADPLGLPPAAVEALGCCYRWSTVQ